MATANDGHDLQTPPDGWVVSTNVSHHVSYLYAEGDHRSIALIRSPDPGSTRWNVRGLAQYGPETPLFAEHVAFERAVDVATTVMEAVTDGSEVEPIRYGVDRSEASDSGVDADSDAPEENGPPDAEDDPVVEQAGLDAFTGGGT